MTKNKQLKSDTAKVRIDDRSRGRMKIVVKLDKDNAQAFKNWAMMVKPDNMDDDEFARQVFFRGVNALNDLLSESTKASLQDPTVRQDLIDKGVDVDKLEKSLGIDVVAEDSEDESE